jgi:uncharacterized protein YegP (UPF0339 family)
VADITDRVEIFRDDAGGWRWRRKNGENGQITSVSGESYVRRDHAVEMAAKMNADLPADALIVVGIDE